MYISLVIAGIYGGAIDSAGLHLQPTKEIQLDDLYQEFGLTPRSGATFFAEAKPLSREAERLEITQPDFLGFGLLQLKNPGPGSYEAVRSHIKKIPDGRESWDLTKEEALSIARELFPGMASVEVLPSDIDTFHQEGQGCWPCFSFTQPYSGCLYFWGSHEDGLRMGLPPVPQRIKGQLDINRFLVIGESRYGWVSPCHLIHERVEGGLYGHSSALRTNGRTAYLYEPWCEAAKPNDAARADAKTAVILHAAHTAFDIEE